MTELPVGKTGGHAIRFMDESTTGKVVEVLVQERDWDVTDAAMRSKVAEEVLGEEIDEYWAQSAQWFINERRNAAALCVFRPRSKDAA